MGTGGPVKRSIRIGKQETSVSLEHVFWDAFKDAAADRGLTLKAFAEALDDERQRQMPDYNLCCYIRVWLWNQKPSAGVRSAATQKSV